MLRKIVLILAVAAISVCCLSGCKKRSSEPEETVKTTEEYEAEAKKEITKDNMAAELDKIEKAVGEEATQEP